MNSHLGQDQPPVQQHQADTGSACLQCWICPHCFDDRHHHSDAQGCERHATSVGARTVVGPTDV